MDNMNMRSFSISPYSLKLIMPSVNIIIKMNFILSALQLDFLPSFNSKIPPAWAFPESAHLPCISLFYNVVEPIWKPVYWLEIGLVVYNKKAKGLV